MGKEAFSCELTGKELIYFLFKKKICPKCGGQMTKRKCCEIVDGTKTYKDSRDLYLRRKNVQHYYYMFDCSKCGAEFPLTDLANE